MKSLTRSCEDRGLRLETLTRFCDHQPRYEVFAPDGRRFTDGTHSRICQDRKDVLDFLFEPRATDTQECPDDCNCKDDGTLWDMEHER